VSNQINKEQELAALKIDADELGITYNANIGIDKLKEKIADASAKSEPEKEEVIKKPKVIKDPKGGRKMTNLEAIISRAKNLVKCKVTNLDAGEAKLKSAYVCAGNQDFEVARVIPFNVPIGLQQCLIEKLKQDKMIQFVDEYDQNGRKTGNETHELVNKYAVEILV